VIETGVVGPGVDELAQRRGGVEAALAEIDELGCAPNQRSCHTWFVDGSHQEM
jgi:hypothetical protein